MKKTPAIQETVTLAQVEDRLITVRGQSVLLDSDVAALYAVQAKEINQAVQRNPEKFPDGYVFHLDKLECESLRSKILTLESGNEGDEAVKNFDHLNSRSQIVTLNDGNDPIKNFDRPSLRSQIVTLDNPGRGRYSKYPPKAFTEKGLYMLATILKGPRAILTTIAIVETFAKIRELARTVARLSETKEKFTQQSLMQKGGEIMADILGEGIKTTDTETSFELNFAVMKLKHTVKRSKQ